MEKNYTAVITQRTPRPRSKRLREMGIGSAAGATVVMSGAAGGTTITGDGHTHANLSALNEISTDTNGYQYLTQIRETEDPETGDTTVGQVTEKVKAGYADEAKDLSEDSPIREMFLSRLADDVAKGNITFERAIKVLGLAYFEQAIKVLGLASFDSDVKIRGLLRLLSGIQSDDFNNSMTAGSGWRIDNNGNAQVQSIEVRSYMRVLELVMNRLSAEESEFIFTESGTVETANPNEDGTYTLVMRKKTDKDITPFQQGDILKGVVNNLAEPGAVGANYYTSWVQVKEVNQTTNSIKVAVYADNDTPAKKNFPPCNLMVLHRWGNTTKKERQSCWYISSIEKRIVMLDGVTQPITTDENLASFYGLPFDMETFKGYSLNKNQPYLYVRGAFLQDVCFIDYLGKVVKQERYRGVWSQEVANSDDPYIVTKTSFDTVYHKNAKWQCNSTKGTKEEPSVGTTDWTKLSEGGKGSDGKSAAKAYVTTNDIAIPTDANGIVTEDFQIGNTFSLMVDGKNCTNLQVTMDGTPATDAFKAQLNQLWLTITSSKGAEFGSLAYTLHFTVTGVLHDETYSDIVTILVRPNKAGSQGLQGNKGDKGDKGDKGEQGPRGLQGLQGERGEQGIPGTNGIDGIDGRTSWFHIKYSSVANPTSASQMTETPSTYIGTYVDFTELDSTDPKKYQWHRFEGLQGEKGEQGIPGIGVDGKTTYLHIKYSNDGGKTFTSNNGETVGDYIGVCTNYEHDDPTYVSAYTWSKTKGEPGKDGADGADGADAKILSLRCDRQVINCDETSNPWDDGNITIEAVLENLSGTVTWTIDWDNASGEEIEDTRYEIRGNVLEITDIYYFTGMCYNIYITARLGQYSAKTTIVVVNDGTNGKNGENGKPLVGPTEWSKDVKYLSGKSNEAYQSIVINPKYPKQMYLCGYSHSGKEPSSQTSTSSVDTCTAKKPWVQVPYQDFVATKVLFAERGKIENLDITNATIQGTITDMSVKTEAEWDKITNSLVPKEEKDYVESNRNFQIVDPSKAGSYFIPTFYPTGRNSNSLIVFLPTYNPSTDYDIITCNTTQSNVKKRYKIPKYQTAGTHIRITKGGAPLEYSRWAYLEDAEYERLWTSNNGNNRNTIRDIYNMGTLICADHKIFKVTDGNGKHGHNITGAWYYGDSDYKHGRLSVNGTVARMLWLMPGQTVELVSQIEEIDNTKCLVWSVVNASDFTAVNINADLTKRKTYDQNFESLTPIEFHGESGILAPNLAGNVDNWEDCFIAHKKIDNLLLNGETKRIPSLFINRNDPAKDDGYPIAEFYIP